LEYITVPWPFQFQGLNTELATRFVPPEALTAVTNMFYQAPDRLRSRGGINRLYTATVPAAPPSYPSPRAAGKIVRIYYWSHEDETYFADDGTGAAGEPFLWSTADHETPISWAAGVSGVAEPIADMVGFGETDTPKLIVAENKGSEGHTLHTWDGTTYATLTGTSVPNVTRLMVRFGRLWGTCDDSFPVRIFWSGVNDETQWAGAWNEGGFVDVAPGQDGAIVDWVEFEGNLWVFKEDGIYRVIGDEPTTETNSFRVERISSSRGALPRAMQDCMIGIIYATKYGVFPVPKIGAVGGATRLPVEAEGMDITRHVERSFQETLDACYVDTRTEWQQLVGLGYGTMAETTSAYSPELGAYLFAQTGQTTIWVSNFNSRPDAWTHFISPAAVHCTYQGDQLYIGSTAGKLYAYNHAGYTDDNAAFTVSFKTGDWDLGDRLHPKNIRFIEGLFNANELGACLVRLYKDGSPTAIVTERVVPGQEPILRVNVNCDRIAFGIEYSALSAPCVFGGVQLRIRPLEAKL